MTRPKKIYAPHLYLTKYSATTDHYRLFVAIPVEPNFNVVRMQSEVNWDESATKFQVEYLIVENSNTVLAGYSTDMVEFAGPLPPSQNDDVLVKVYKQLPDSSYEVVGECLIELNDADSLNILPYIIPLPVPKDSKAALNIPYVYLTKPDFTNPGGNYHPHVLVIVKEHKYSTDCLEYAKPRQGVMGLDALLKVELDAKPAPQLEVILPTSSNTVVYQDIEEDNFLEVVVQTIGAVQKPKTRVRNKNSDDKPSPIYLDLNE